MLIVVLLPALFFDVLAGLGLFVAIYFHSPGLLVVSPFTDQDVFWPVSVWTMIVWIVSLAFWAWICFIYARVTRRIRTFHFVLLTYPLIVAVNYLFFPVWLSFNLFGIEPAVTMP